MPTRLRVLIVEDRSQDADLMIYELRRAGFQPDWQRVQEETAYVAILDTSLDLILADYHWPQFNALRALVLLRDRELDIPFIVVTGSQSEEAAVECMKQGATDYLLKDRLTRLGQAVFRAIELKHLRAEKRRAEEALRASEQNLRQLAENTSDLIARHTPEGIYVYASPASQVLFGRAPDELVGRSIFDLCHPDDTPTLAGAYQAAPEAPHALTITNRVRRLDGSYVWCETAHSRVPAFSDPSAVHIQTVARDVSERKHAEEFMKTSLREKEVLLREVHHRVKNNLQVISSLLKLQSQHIKDQRSLELFKESQNRVRSIALVHEKLYRRNDLARIDFAEYVRGLAAHLMRSCGVKTDSISLNVDAEPILLNVETAIPCGLVINELVTNSLRHAFPAGKGSIMIDFRRGIGDQLVLSVQDTGIGLPALIDTRNNDSLGWQLIHALADQLKANIEIGREAGTHVSLTFTESRYKAREWQTV
jgi:PAS domain S-box-containing protein